MRTDNHSPSFRMNRKRFMNVEAMRKMVEMNGLVPWLKLAWALLYIEMIT